MSEKLTDFGFRGELTDAEKQAFFEQAAYWEVRAEDALRAYRYAITQRRLALLALGMIKDEGDLNATDK